jgi:hypothetical protein
VVQLTPRAHEDLVQIHRSRLSWCLQLESRLVRASRWFAEAGGVDHMVVKGPAIAHLDEQDASLRTFADIDLLVRDVHLEPALAALERHGAVRPYRERRPGFDRRFAKSVTVVFSDGVEFDVHRSICDGVHGFRIPHPELFDEPQRFEVAGVEMKALAPVHRLLHAAYHAVLGSPRPKLMSLRDIAGYLVAPDIGCPEAVAEARRWRGEAVLAAAVRELQAAFGWVPEPWADWLHGVEVDAREQRVIDRQKVEGSSFGPAKVAAMRELPWRDRPAYALGVAVPSRDHLRSRDVSRLDHLSGGRWGRISRRAPSA